MSFRIFAYYCALCGGWAAFMAWALGEVLDLRLLESGLLYWAVLGGILGALVAGAVGALTAMLNACQGNRSGRILVSVFIGLVGGLAGGVLCEVLTTVAPWLRFLGWMIVGLAIGMSVGMYDVGQAFVNGKSLRLVGRKLIDGVLGGTLGGVTGGLVYLGLDILNLHNSLPRTSLALGLVILGTLIGLLVGLAQVLLKPAWIRVEAGFRPGRELILSKAETTIGRAASCDIGLFGDSDVDSLHSRILLKQGRFVLADAASSSGTFLNDQRVTEPVALRTGDRIRIGGHLLRFGERGKR